MKLELHTEAAKNFNSKAEGLLAELTSVPLTPHQGHQGPLDPDVHVAAHFNPQNIIGDVKVKYIDYSGNEVAKSFELGAARVGLFGDGYKNLVRIAEGMHKSRAIQNAVSLGLLIDLIFDWVRLRHQAAPVPQMTDYVLGECEKRLEDVEIWIPVYMLHVQSPLTIGWVTLTEITRAMLDEWHGGMIAQVPEESRAVVEHHLSQERSKFQGFAAATLKMRAEPERAAEVAFEEAEQCLALLRFFAPASFNPKYTSYCVPLGREHVESSEYLTVRDGKITSYFTGVVDMREPAWALSTKKIAELRANGIDALNGMLAEPKRSEYQEDLLAALRMYSKSALAKDFADRLVYMLIALESMFLRNNSEPIVDNISERMALFAGQTVSERRAIVSNVKKTYGLRSAFVHHGRGIGIDEITTLEKFMVTAWRCMQSLIGYAADGSATKVILLDRLEDMKLSGGASGA
ncbi:MAG: hypothetical protein LC802_22560 [Acidobacteria bacterium]|nr:hypothetical protein [Acidobacteriota bacterium]